MPKKKNEFYQCLRIMASHKIACTHTLYQQKKFGIYIFKFFFIYMEKKKIIKDMYSLSSNILYILIE